MVGLGLGGAGCAGLMGRVAPQALLAVLLAAPVAAQAATAAPIPLELNKLEPQPVPAGQSEAGCRIYMVVNNPDADPITQLRLDLMLFGTDGVVARRVALDLAPLAAHKTSVRLFDVVGQPCDGIAKILVNDVLACETGKHDGAAGETNPQLCLDRLQVSARGKTELAK